jgi:TolB-like protein
MVLLGYLLLSGRTGHEGLHSVAVLPFRDNSPDKDLGYLSNGIRDGLTSLLVRNRRIEVTARASSAQVAEQSNPGRVAAELQTDTLVSGSVSPSGNGAQVVITLVQGRTGKYLWSRTYLVKPGDLAIVEQSAATEIAQALGVAAAAVAPVVPSTPEAVESYLKACALARLRTPDGSREAARLFEQVLRAEPDFARGYAAAASNYLVAGQNGAIPWADSGIRGVDLARKSLALDPALSEAHASMALGLQTQWKWQESMDELAKASALDPRSPVPHFRMAYTLTILRRFPEAEREINIARQLDPAWIAAHGLLAEIYLYERQYDAALDFARRFRTTTRDPFFDDLIARVSISQGNWDVARPLLSKSQSPFLRALSRAAGGDVHGAYENLLSDVKSGNATAYHLASFCVLQIHDRALTLNWLKQSFHDHDPDLVTVMLDPMWDGLRNDSQVTDMMKAMNLL